MVGLGSRFDISFHHVIDDERCAGSTGGVAAMDVLCGG